MSQMEYSNLLFEISRRLDQLNVREQLLFMCRRKITRGVENIQDALSLFRELEEKNSLQIDRLEVLKELLKGLKEWSLFQKVKNFEIKRKEYSYLLELISRVFDESNHLEQLLVICRRKTSVEYEGNIQDVRTLFKELENRDYLEFGRLDLLKVVFHSKFGIFVQKVPFYKQISFAIFNHYRFILKRSFYQIWEASCKFN